MIVISLTRGFVAIVDDEDADLAAHKWCAMTDGYGQRRSGGKLLLLHRVIGERIAGVPIKGLVVDHMNGDPTDNRRSNLRVVRQSENIRNSPGSWAHGKSGHRGVCFIVTRQRWLAHISGRHLGYFQTLEAAVTARLAAEREQWGIQPRRAEAHAGNP